METYQWEHDQEIICETVENFPQDIRKTFDVLQAKLPNCDQRSWFAISRMKPDGGILYKAAGGSLHKGEAKELGLEGFTITQGNYLCEKLKGWMQNPAVIGEAFNRLIADPRMDTSFPCLEWYHDVDQVTCFVRMKE